MVTKVILINGKSEQVKYSGDYRAIIIGLLSDFYKTNNFNLEISEINIFSEIFNIDLIDKIERAVGRKELIRIVGSIHDNLLKTAINMFDSINNHVNIKKQDGI